MLFIRPKVHEPPPPLVQEFEYIVSAIMTKHNYNSSRVCLNCDDGYNSVEPPLSLVRSPSKYLVAFHSTLQSCNPHQERTLSTVTG